MLKRLANLSRQEKFGLTLHLVLSDVKKIYLGIDTKKV